MVRQFGGRNEKLGRDWFKRFQREKTKPLKIGNRLVVVRSTQAAKRCSVRCPQRKKSSRSDDKNSLRTAHTTAPLVIPAGAAFGTGDHATTAMSLRLLERLTRNWKPGWSMVDLGTGSGILALAGSRFGAGQITAVDLDPMAISTAKANARVNKIHGVELRAADVRRVKLPARIDVVSANLFNELLIEIMPRLKGCRWLILSGVMRSQEGELRRALRRNRIEIVQARRRGKWVAIWAKNI